MQCPGCGNVVDLAAAFCGRCGQRLNHDVALRVPARRPAVITMLAVFQFLGGATWMFFGVAVLSAFRVVPQQTRASGIVVSALIGFGCLGFGILQIAGGVGLLKLKRYGRSILRFFSILGLLGFPVGTIISIVVLVYLNTPGVKLLFSERPVQELSTTEYAQLVAAAQSSTATTVVVIVGVLVVGVFALGIVAAIVVPGLLLARLASNEAAAIAMLRTFAAAERSYASANGGRYGSPECLMTPATCIAGYRGQPFLTMPVGRAFGSRGYVFQFFSSETTDPQNVLAEPARRIQSFAVLALPMTAQTTGRRSFCVDASGRVTWAVTLKPPSVLMAACPVDWNELHSNE